MRLPAIAAVLLQIMGVSAIVPGAFSSDMSGDSLLAHADITPAFEQPQISVTGGVPPALSLWSREQLSGDWWGTREGLVQNGLEIQALYRSDVFRNNAGGLSSGSGSINNLDLTLDVHGDAFLPWSGTRVFIHFLANNGGSIYRLVGDAQMVSNIESPRVAKLYQAYIEHTIGDGGVSLLFGLLDMNAEFYVTPSSGMFLNGSHGVGKELSQMGINGPSVFPNTALAARVRIPVTGSVYSQLAVFDGVPGTEEDPMATSFAWRWAHGCFAIAECGYSQESSDAEAAQKIVVGGWWYPRSEMNDVPNRGAYFLAERQVFHAGEDGTNGLTLFVRYGIADDAVNRFGSHLGVGGVFKGLIPGRDEDQLGFAVASAIHAAAYMSANDDKGILLSQGEINLELTYRIAVTPWMIIQPDVQYVRSPDADLAIPDATVFGTRLEFHL
jgi:porin